MSLWERILRTISGESSELRSECPVHASHYAMVDVEVGVNDKTIHDIGALLWDRTVFHSSNRQKLLEFLEGVDFLCGHNIIHHDIEYLFGAEECHWNLIDTLYMSPLLFPERPYHRLLKDDKLVSDQINNPVNDCEKSHDLLMDEVGKWYELSESRKIIFATLLRGVPEFDGFLKFVKAKVVSKGELSTIIHSAYQGAICERVDIESLSMQYPCELAYALSLVDTTDWRSITPPWVLRNFPNVEYVVKCLRHTKCNVGCEYCNKKLDVHYNLKRFFGYDQFRTYEGDPLQENAVKAAVSGDSLLAIFPTGGGKSLTFQLPALMAGKTQHGLTVVISPLQSLMKDQVDNLAERGIYDAVTINGLLDPISRSYAIKRVMDGEVSLLYIAPEMLRSKTIERILQVRHVVRFVIDEAHCFSSWGQDFRVDYLYIGKFIREYQKRKRLQTSIPISCFTATAKQKVVQDICDYFKKTLDIELQLFASSATRTNLHYSVIYAETDDEKYMKLRSLIAEHVCPTIVYVSRTKRTEQLAEKLSRDGYKALPYNGRMDADQKVINQDAFMNDQVRIIVATSAFGMGVDKSDVGLVVHYDISDSLENYVQEAGRAGRNPHLEACCYVLYCDNDLDKHFILLNQTKLSLSEIQQVWSAVKRMTKVRVNMCCSALEIAREVGWDDSGSEMETRVRTALAALEQAGYIERGNNVPHVYATGITVKNMDEARKRITESVLFDGEEIEKAVRIMKSLISQKHIAKAQDDLAESRIDYLADILGLTKNEVVSFVERMRQEGILADTKDMSAFLQDIKENQSKRLLEQFAKLESYLLHKIQEKVTRFSYKQLNDNAQNEGVAFATEKDIRTLLYFLAIRGYAQKREDASRNVDLLLLSDVESSIKRFEKRLEICRFTVNWLYNQIAPLPEEEMKKKGVQFSIVELLNDFKKHGTNLLQTFQDVQIEDVEEALLYLSKIGALKLEGGFLVLYNAMDIRRVKDSKLRYKQEDYRLLNEFYKQKIQQVHIVGEYANLMVRDYQSAVQYVQDYFQMDYKRFVLKYFKGERLDEIERNVTPGKYQQLFGELSSKQMEIISDKESRCIVVAAGPGSGKTRVLVHKLASLLLLEDVKHEQLLMLTFSRAAATEFKQRLMALIGNAAHFVEIKTFHSYCFDLLGRIGNLDDARDVVKRAANMIREGDVEPNRIAKTVLVIDEAQDMSEKEYDLVNALMERNEEMRVIVVGDDDQNIFEFRGSQSKYMAQFCQDSTTKFVEMNENYRSSKQVVEYANRFVAGINGRMKTEPIVSMSMEEGWVGVAHYASGFMYHPLVKELKAQPRIGTICVLTQTNEEAVILVALLRKEGLKGKLIQSMDGFRFWNLAEVRFFLKHLDLHVSSPLIGENVWKEAKQKTFSAYETSSSLCYLKRCVELFEETNKSKYLTDFKEFVFESAVEDFCELQNEDIVVSTIHKAKGREFDDVYMLISDVRHLTDEHLRRFYVGMTRAKKRLFIHTNSSLFEKFVNHPVNVDTHLYDMPNEVVLQLSHKDVNLGYFKPLKKELLSLRAGQLLRFENNYLYDISSGKPICLLSQKKQSELSYWYGKGYVVTSAIIRFVVAWRPKDAPKEEKEHAVLLADLTLNRQE
ncbi:MAG: RecQ family ATP-dependent DNA helicase [Bacteroidaceae bacterium]|nr:RecQ family ATP-dependent DNA helicase [Bacteroidaceae bacterium]